MQASGSNTQASQGDVSSPTHAAMPWLDHYPQGVVWDQTFAATPVPAILDGAVAKFGHRPCTTFLGRTQTYAEIGRQVDKAALGLQRMGVVQGTKVGLLLPNTPTFVIFYYAALKIGATIVNYNPLYTLEELAYQVKDSGTSVIVTLDLKLLFDKVEALLASGALKHAVVASFPSLLPTSKAILYRMFKGRDLASVRKSPEAAKISTETDLLNNDGKYAPVAIDPLNDIAVLQYTGGTTGTPKGAMLTHANLTISVEQVIAWSRHFVDGEERVLAILPFFHVFAMTGVMNLGLRIAAELFLMPRFVLADALKLMDSAKPTFMAGVPTIYNAIINSKDVAKLDFTSLKLCVSGGAPLPAEVKKAFEAITHATLIEAYGLSETSPGATFNPVDGKGKAGSIGQPLPGTTISIREVGNPEREMPLGQPGEICIKGPQVMKGYWNKPEDTADVMLGDFFRSGDVGYMDAEGYTFIVDRIKDMIICSGFKVFPRRIEEALYEHPAVEEVTVIGIKNAYRGEAPKAFVKLKADHKATQEELMKFLAVKISKIEMPEEIEFRAELPKSMIGKLSKKELKAEEAAKVQAPGKV